MLHVRIVVDAGRIQHRRRRHSVRLQQVHQLVVVLGRRPLTDSRIQLIVPLKPSRFAPQHGITGPFGVAHRRSQADPLFVVDHRD